MELGSLILVLTFVAGLGVFAGGWIAGLGRRESSGLGGDVEVGPTAVEGEVSLERPLEAEQEESPYQSPKTVPPPLSAELSPPPIHGLSPRLYQVFDLPLIGLVLLIYFSQVWLSATMETQDLVGSVTAPALVVAMSTQLIIGGIVVGFVAWRMNPVRWLGLNWSRWPLALLIAPLVLVGMWIFLAVLETAGFNEWVQQWSGHGVQDTVMLFQETDDPLVLALLCLLAVVVAPVTEEVIFRGYLYPASKRFCGKIPAMIFSSLIFTAAHNNAVALLPLFILALVLVGVYEMTKSIWAPIACHAMFNGATVTIQMLIRMGVVEMPPA